MFERYTEKARRVIFFARYEASHLGSPYIESEHMLLGLLREDKVLNQRLNLSQANVESIRRQVEEHIVVREKIATSVDLPLSPECKRILAYAVEEAERLASHNIGTEHLLLGILREEESFAAELLDECGVRIDAVRATVASAPAEPPPEPAPIRLKTPLFTVRFADVSGKDLHPPYHAPLPGGLPRIGETLSVTPQAGPELIYRVRDVRWSYLLHGSPVSLQSVVLTLEPIAPEKPAAP
jgi:hypothetical protein